MSDRMETLRKEAQRVQALAGTRLYGVPDDESFDRLSGLAARLTASPLVFLSLINADRAFYGSNIDFDQKVPELWSSFGPHTLASDGPLVINETLAHPTYKELPAVQATGVRAYCGIPLVAQDGRAIGGLCAVDLKPRIWSPLDIETLIELAQSALREIHLRGQLREAQMLARAAEQQILEKERLLASIAHDLRSPLMAINLSFDLIKDANLAPALKLKMAAAFRSSSHSMTGMLDQLLELPGASDASDVTPEELVLDSIVMMEPLAVHKNIKLLSRLTKPLPPVAADYQRILRVFSNLIVNAIQFSAPESTIFLDAEEEAGAVRFSVSDSGCGIAEAHLPHIFDQRWQAVRTDAPGAGMGLSIVREIVLDHGGAVGVSSVVNQGTTVYFSLPILSH